MQSISTASLPIPDLPATATKAHGFPHLASGSLLSVGQLCDHQCTAVFTSTKANIYHNKDIQIIPKGQSILEGTRSAHDQLWSVQLVPPTHPLPTPAQHKAFATVIQPSLPDRISFYHAALFSPVLTTWLKAIKLNNLDSWPELSAKQIAKYGRTTEATIKGHQHAKRSNIQSTKKFSRPTLPLTFAAAAANVTNIPQPPSTEATTRTNQVFINIEEPTGRIFADQTGKFVCASRKGNKYIFILYDYDSNTISAEPISSRIKSHLAAAYRKIISRLTERGFKPKLAKMDNEISDEVRSLLTSEDIDYELTPVGLHRRNLAERAIQTFKNHFIAGLCSTHPDFPLNLWDELLPQCTLTLNLLRQSRLNPQLSAHAHVYGPFNYARTPIAPPGMKILVHERSTDRGSYDVHAITGWYLGPSLKHYRCHKVWIPQTSSTRIADQVTWLPHNIPMPTATTQDLIIASAKDLTAALQLHTTNSLLPPSDTVTRNALLQLSNIFANKVLPNDNTIISHNKPQPDPILPIPPVPSTQQPPTVTVPRVPSNLAKLPRVPKYVPPSSTKEFLIHNNARKSLRRRIQKIPPAPPASPSPALRRSSRAPHPTRRYVTNATVKLSPCLPPHVQALIEQELRRADSLPDLNTHKINAVLDSVTGKLLEYRDLLKTDSKERWYDGCSKEFARLCQGRKKDDTTSTNTIFFKHPDELPPGKKATYLRICSNYRPQKADPYRVRFTVGGNLVDYRGNTYTPTADLTTAKLLINSILSTPGAKFLGLDLSNFYLISPFADPSQYEYMWIPAWVIPKDIMEEYNLKTKIKNGKTLAEIRTGMYGLPQAGRMAYKKLIKHLAADGYIPTGFTPGLFKHLTRPVLFCLVVDDFGAKIVGRLHGEHLINSLKKHYDITIDWDGAIFCGVHLNWDYDKRTCDLHMPNYVTKAAKRFQVKPPSKPEHSPHKWYMPKYGKSVQLTPAIDTNPRPNPTQIKFAQEVIGTFLYYARAVDNTMLASIGAIATALSTSSWLDIRQRLDQFLRYAVTHPDARIQYKASKMHLWIHTDSSYLNVPKARSRGGGYFHLSDKPQLPIKATDPPPPLNAPVLVNSKVIPNVMSSAQEAETGMGFLNARDAVPIRQTLTEMGHPQGPTPIQFDNIVATGIMNDTVTQRRSKAMDMRFYWLKDRAAQKQFHIHWKRGASNLADYYTKHHPTKHHKEVRPTYVLNATLDHTYKSWYTTHHRKGVLKPNIPLSTSPWDSSKSMTSRHTSGTDTTQPHVPSGFRLCRYSMKETAKTPSFITHKY